MSFTLGIFGGGVVGGGVVEVLKAKEADFAAMNVSFKVAKICVRDLNKKRDFEVPEGCTFVTTKEGTYIHCRWDTKPGLHNPGVV
jgi:homoserine dehydrogenase